MYTGPIYITPNAKVWAINLSRQYGKELQARAHISNPFTGSRVLLYWQAQETANWSKTFYV
jgi:hypothetical protein